MRKGTEVNFASNRIVAKLKARRCERSEAIQRKLRHYPMLLDCFASLATTGFSIHAIIMTKAVKSCFPWCQGKPTGFECAFVGTGADAHDGLF